MPTGAGVPDQSEFRELITDFTIHNDVGDFSDEYGLYLILLQNHISGVGFYFGLQTDANWRGKAVIFSRWETDQLADARWDEMNGWYELGKHEGGFLGVRRLYDWGAGDYRVRIAPDGLASDGEWFGLWITDLSTNETTWIGSLKFPFLDGTATMPPRSYATIELYGNPQIRPIDIPEWHVSVNRPSGDGVPATWGFTSYPYDDSENALRNSDVWYDTPEGMAHLVVGGLTQRSNPAVARIDFKTEISLADLEYGAWLDANSPSLADQLKALPWVADGVEDSERPAAEALIAAARWYPDTFNALLHMSWVVVSVNEHETTVIRRIRWTAKDAPPLAEAMLQKSWVQDGITRDEAMVIERLYWIIRTRNESLQPDAIQKATELLAMPFLDSVESPDAMAVWDLEKVERYNTNDFLSIMAHANVSDGITDREAKVVAVLSSANRYKPDSLPILLDGLDGTGGVYLEERTTDLAHSGEVQLTIIRVQDKDTPNMDRLEHAVRVVEEFMGEPLPTNYVAWYLDDAARSAGKGYHAGTHITSSLVYDIVDGNSKSRTPMQHIAHEVGHYYFRGNTHQWLDEGPAKFFESISERERVGRPIAYFKQSCGPAETIQEQEQLRNDIRAGRITAPDGWTQCDYYLGERFFVDLYLAMGDEAFRPGLRSLYLKSQRDDLTDDCEGTDLSLCHVEAAFKAGASDAAVAKVDEVIDRWYYGETARASAQSIFPVVTRDLEYDYSISVSDDWVKESQGRYTRTSPWSHLRITSIDLGNRVTLAQYAAWIRDGLKAEWWESPYRFETTSFQKVQIDGRDFYSITYRVQESPEYCVVDVAELITVSKALPGSQHGYRARMWMCEGNAAEYGQDRVNTLRSFRTTIRPSTYYRQFLSVQDVVIKAKDTVDPAALYAAGDIVNTMLSGRPDIKNCMANVGAGLAIIPKDDYLTTLPEFSHLKGTSDFTGRPRDSFAIRGLGAVKGQPVSATSEEQLLGLPKDQYPHNRFPHVGLITVHEFAHGLQNLCFTQKDWERWNEFYDAAKRSGVFPGTHMMNDVYEFFAVLSTAYFEVTDEIGRGAGRNSVETMFPDAFESLEEIYGSAVLAAEYRERKF